MPEAVFSARNNPVVGCHHQRRGYIPKGCGRDNSLLKFYLFDKINIQAPENAREEFVQFLFIDTGLDKPR
ncbi:MAG: hypothetical protein MZV70_16495 [Desulfobacterales bacterium]|nr:hypothetical protein [Desulfobacterales bacterium]